MTAATLTIADFLLARIAEDEAAAKTARDTEAGYIQFGDNAAEALLGLAESEGTDDEGLAHFGRWMPARVLAECEAKRAIVEEHRPVDYAGLGMRSPNACHICGVSPSMGDWEWDEDSFPCATLRALAAVYADHEDYREEWRV